MVDIFPYASELWVKLMSEYDYCWCNETQNPFFFENESIQDPTSFATPLTFWEQHMQIAMEDTNTWTIKLTGHQNVPFSNTSQKIDTYFGMRVDSDGLSENVLIYLLEATGTEVSKL